jgi:hypothetical protein
MDIISLIAGFTLITLLLVLAGRKRAIFECVLIYDSAKLWFGDRFAKSRFTDASKDYNLDGKVSYLERTFPKDGGHRAKLWEVIYLGLAAGYIADQSFNALILASLHDNIIANAYFLIYKIPLLLNVLLAAFWFLVYSGSFVFFHSRYRKPPKHHELFNY